MSVQVNQYILCGINLDQSTYNEKEDILDDYHESPFSNSLDENKLILISDYMNGKYNYLGICYRKTTDYEFMATTDIDAIDKSIYDKAKKLIKELIDVDCEPHLYFITRYS